MTGNLAAAALLAGWLAAVSAWAHDIVILADAERVEVKYGHPGDWQYADREKLIDLRWMDGQGADGSLREGLARDGLSLVSVGPDPGGSLVHARYDNGVWVRLPDGSYRNARPSLVAEAVDSLTSVKYAKALVRPGSHATVVGHPLELVPLQDPFQLRPGGTLPVRVLLDGRPLADARVELGDGLTVLKEEDIAKFATDAQGVARIPVTRTGWQILAVDVDRASPVPVVARTEKMVATLVFFLR